jgi:hypothetical protein
VPSLGPERSAGRLPCCRKTRPCADGTRRLYQLQPDALAAVRDYLDWYWTQALETFRQHVEAEGDAPMEPELKVSK